MVEQLVKKQKNVTITKPNAINFVLVIYDLLKCFELQNFAFVRNQ